MPQLITTTVCTRAVTKQTKTYDTKCPGFYVSVTAKCATFSLKFWNKVAAKQDTIQIGTYHPQHLTVEAARAKALDLKARAERGEDIKHQVTVAKIEATAGSITVGEVIDEFIAYIKKPVLKADGEKRPRIESWKNVEGFLEKNVRPAIGSKACSQVTNNDIANVQNTVAARSTSAARQTRSAMKRLFAYAAEAGRSYVAQNPCVNLPKLDKEYGRSRVLSPDEIRTFWWGLDDPNLPCIRSISLALKFEMVSMLRSQEVRAVFRSERSTVEHEQAGTMEVIRIPAKYVKKRRVILQPLNSLALDILKQATRTHNHDVVFANTRSNDDNPMLNRSALNQALNQKRTKHNTRMPITEYLGMKHFTVHDLRRTVATLCGDLGFSDGEIAKCLDHSKDRGEDVVEAPSVTGRVYNHSTRLAEKLRVLNALDKELRRIIGQRPARVSKLAA